LKQVVGDLFSGFGLIDRTKETDIVKALTDECEKCRITNRRTSRHEKKRLERAAEKITVLLQNLIGPILQLHLQSLKSQIFSDRTELRWRPVRNHCQKLCESILDHDYFKDFIGPKYAPRSLYGPANSSNRIPIYLFSFLCETGDSEGLPHLAIPKSTQYAPNGLTEEYLLRFRKFGHHNESDIVDTLSEYWWDWGAFGGTIFPHQRLFPWDCTEAFGTGLENNGQDVRCGDCSLLKHVWAFPFDSWSLISLHMLRPRESYQEEAEQMSDLEWTQNRIECLSALHCLNAVAVGIRRTPKFRTQCRWMPNKINHFRPEVKSSYLGLVRRRIRPAEQAILDYAHGRSRMAGIFRAQPNSHFFEQSERSDCHLSHWADLQRDDQIIQYTLERNARADMLEFPEPMAEYGRSHQSNTIFLSDNTTTDGTNAQGVDTPVVDRDSENNVPSDEIPQAYLVPGQEFVVAMVDDEPRMTYASIVEEDLYHEVVDINGVSDNGGDGDEGVTDADGNPVADNPDATMEYTPDQTPDIDAVSILCDCCC
jgi:hypothetical protein